MFEIIIGILPFIIPSSVLKENLGSLILFLIGSIFILIKKNKLKENKYFYILIAMWISIVISQIIISPYIESISGSFLYLNMAIYYLIYGYILKGENKEKILNFTLLAIVAVCIFYITYHGLYQGIRVFGNIGYANSYAMLHLIGLYLNGIRTKDKFTDAIETILFLSLLFTGSRTTLIISVLYIFYKLYVDIKDNKIKLIISLEPIILGMILYVILDKLKIVGIVVLPIILIFYILIKNIKFKDKIYYFFGVFILLALLFTNSNLINRLKDISFSNGTLQERILYFEDSINSIIEHPFGNGINMFQYKLFEDATAFYDVKYIHNSILQVAYDAGVINCIAFIGVIAYGVIIIAKSKNKDKSYIILAYISILLHSLLDFDLSFSTFPIILMMLVTMGEISEEEKRVKNKNNKYTSDKEIKVEIRNNLKIKKVIYIILATISIYLTIFEATIVLGRYLININDNLADNLFSFSNNISFKWDYRGYFNGAQVKKNLYDKSNDDKYLKEGISLLEISKEINIYDPMVTWNLSYMHELLDEDEKALDYGQEVLERERFYPEAYIKQHDYLMNLYSKTGDEKYETKVKELEEYYYKNYNELNKRAKYMNNQLQENYDDIRSENLDYNILLNGKYEKEMKYFSQEDEKWARFPYKTVNNPLSKTGCGVTAMAMIQATMNELEVTPIDMAKYSIEKDYCNNDTSIEFFDEVAKDERYKLNLEKFDGNEITKVKRLLSDGKHIAVALMRPGDFTTEGHYLVLYGIETINGINYFNALDSNKDNNNYSDSGNIIYNKPKDGFIKVKSSLFLEQCIQFFVYSI